ncbi:MAG: hypothetical protein LC798_20455 [Chloroflexi bacterium]|nr:hypothetical protein [Chloroflexota bacterium]
MDTDLVLRAQQGDKAAYTALATKRRWAPSFRLLPADEPTAADGYSSVVDRDQLESGFRRLSIEHRAVVVLHHYLDLPLDRVAETQQILDSIRTEP